MLLYVKICPADCSGWEPLRLRLPLQDLDVRWTSPRRPEAFVTDVKFARSHHTVGYAPGTLGLGLA